MTSKIKQVWNVVRNAKMQPARCPLTSSRLKPVSEREMRMNGNPPSTSPCVKDCRGMDGIYIPGLGVGSVGQSNSSSLLADDRAHLTTQWHWAHLTTQWHWAHLTTQWHWAHLTTQWHWAHLTAQWHWAHLTAQWHCHNF